jgi:hypothetical protein
MAGSGVGLALGRTRLSELQAMALNSTVATASRMKNLRTAASPNMIYWACPALFGVKELPGPMEHPYFIKQPFYLARTGQWLVTNYPMH